MCFSSSVSFGAAAVLTVIGTASLKKVNQPNQFAFAFIPAIFAVQQLAEGFVWIASKNGDSHVMLQISTCVFLFFAQMLWPVWVPVSILLLEKHEGRKKGLAALIILGAFLAAYHLYCLILFPIEVNISGKHIAYVLNHPLELQPFEGAIYILVTIVPPFFSSVKKMWALGLITLLSYVITSIFYISFIISVWCFFAAAISILILLLMDQINDDSELEPATW